jgi:tetratricopeptide (TPR) repeat protein
MQLSIEQALETAQRLLQNGQPAQAEAMFRQILASQPNHPMALLGMGLLAYQCRRADAALFLRQAIAANPDLAAAHLHLGLVLQAQGQTAAALDSFRRAAEFMPAHPDAFLTLGNALAAQHEFQWAADCFSRAIQLRPENPQAYYNLGNALNGLGQTTQAIAAFSKAITLYPDFPQAHNNLGNALLSLGQADAAIAAYRRAIECNPHCVDALNNLGNALVGVGSGELAIPILQDAIAQQPGIPEIHNNLGNALRDQGKFAEATSAYQQALSLKSDYVAAQTNLGNMLSDCGHQIEAIQALRKAVAMDPRYPEPHYGLSLALLSAGQFREGWKEHESRWGVRNFPTLRRKFSVPQWDGSDLGGKTLLIHSEQGFGDVIQFLRFVPLAARRANSVQLQLEPDLRRLAGTLDSAGSEIIIDDPSQQSRAPFNFHLPMMSLPLVLGLNEMSELASPKPYLHADEKLAKDVAPLFDSAGNRLKVGLAWRGHPKPFNRSVPAKILAKLARPDVCFYRLQINEIPGEADAAAPLQMIDLAGHIKDFADTAALVANLDLLISIDTALAHLGGAMARPTWVMLSYVADWRWNLDRDRCPWYPSMRIFRQRTHGDWPEAIARIAAALDELILARAN